MASSSRVLSVLRGAAWLVRAQGLRAFLTQFAAGLGELDRRVGDLRERLDETSRRLDAAALRERQDAERGRWQELRDLRAFERCVSSQNGEDGILEEIFRRVGVESRTFVEFGVESGAQCNCARLVVEDGWRGLFLEADPGQYAKLAERYRDRPGVRCALAEVTSSNIEDLLATYAVPREFDLLSIDIDGNDYWVWSAIRAWSPRVVAIEYNAAHPPPRRWVMKENPGYRWDGTTYYGASLASLAALGRQKGYALVGTCSAGVNAFFVRAELAGKFLDPVLHYHYSPPSYGPFQGGHPPADGPCVEI